MRVWPLAALAVYLAPVGTFPYHAFQGMAIPLAVLAVQGVVSVWPRPRPALVVACLALMVVPGTVHRFEVAVNSIRAAGDPVLRLRRASRRRSTRWRPTRGPAACSRPPTAAT